MSAPKNIVKSDGSGMVNAELSLHQKNAERRFYGTPTFDA
jgi:hypothetical protein